MDNLVCIRLFLAMLFFIQVASLTCDDGDFLDGDHCSKCPYQCQFCESKERCLSCITGFWGSACENSCSRCKDGTSCEKTTGFCLDSCKPGYTGAQCDSNCSEKCSSCDRTSAQTCLNCALGRYPPNSCDKYCPSSCNNQICNASDFCISGCTNGYWGQLCNESCAENCRESSCFQVNGTCLLGEEETHKHGFGTGSKSATSIYIVVAIIAVLISVAIVTAVVLYRKKRCTCFRPVQTAISRRFNRQRHGEDTENPDETAKLNEATTTTIHNGASEAASSTNKTEAKRLEQTADTPETNAEQSRVADLRLRYKTFVCCVTSRGTEASDGPGKNDVVVSQTETSSKTRTMKSRASDMLQRFLGCVTAPGKEASEKHGDITVEEPLNAVENGSEGENLELEENVPKKKKTREEKLQELEKRLNAKTDEDYESEFISLPTVKPITPSHKKKNRIELEDDGIFKDDEHLVIVHGKRGEELLADASFIKDKDDGKIVYVASGGIKKDDSFTHLWMLMLEYDCKTIAMLNTFRKEKKKKEKYWPSVNKTKSYGKLTVQCTSEVAEPHVVTRLFQLKKGKEVCKFVTQLQYTKWSEGSAPEDITSLLHFLRRVKLAHLNDNGPLVVHGRCGVGRTGTFIALNMLLKEVEAMADSDEEKEIDIYSCVASLRSQRSNMVETIEQYKFLHEALSYSVLEMLKVCRGQQSEDVEERNEKNAA